VLKVKWSALWATDMGDDEWWFEGLRIDLAYRRQGIAREFNRYHVQLAQRLGGKVMRYMTGGENTGSQIIGARRALNTYHLHLRIWRSIIRISSAASC
jgi:sugar phosphate isomerase/epimerase